jgi:hypothetical protein
LGAAPFANFMRLTNWLFGKTDATHRIALDRLAGLVTQWLQLEGMAKEQAVRLVGSDYAGKVASTTSATAATSPTAATALPQRQARHLAA